MLVKYDPFKELRELEKRIFNSSREHGDTTFSGFTPNVNTREDEKSYYVEVDLPGVKKEDITIDLNNGILTISGERKYQKEIKENDYYRVETSFGKFKRSFSIDDNIDVENIKATSTDGVLNVVIPKKEKDVSKKTIKIS